MRGALFIGVMLLSTTFGGIASADAIDSAQTLNLAQIVRPSHAAPEKPTLPPRIHAEPDRVEPARPKLDLLRASVVARDWRGAFAVAGERSLLSDSFRLTRSSRMIVGRVTVGIGRLRPFAHLGLGEWRVDRDFLPLSPLDQEFATQLSGGVEMHLAKQTRLAWESDYTLLCREKREPQNLPTPRVLGAFAVLETKF